MPTAIDIANWSLDLIGQPHITSFEDGTKASKLVNRMYPLVRDEVQRAHPWRWLRARASLAADATAPAWGYDRRYQIPADMLRLLDVYKGDIPQFSGWELEGQYILTNEASPIYIRYIAQQTDPNRWDSLLRSAIAARLASQIAEPLTQDPSKRNFARAEYKEIMKHARLVSAQEGNATSVNVPDRWESVRYGSVFDPEYRDITEV